MDKHKLIIQQGSLVATVIINGVESSALVKSYNGILHGELIFKNITSLYRACRVLGVKVKTEKIKKEQ